MIEIFDYCCSFSQFVCVCDLYFAWVRKATGKQEKRMDYNKEIAELKAKREKLEVQLNTKGIDKEEKHDIKQRIIAVDSKIATLYSKLPGYQVAKYAGETKTVQFFDEYGDLVTRVVTQSAFDRWMTDASCLVPIDSGGNEEPQQVSHFPIVDDNKLYRLYHHPVDTKAQLQHFTDIYEHEFGKACKQLLRDDRSLLGDSYEVQEMTDQTKKGKLPLNEFAYRFDATTEVDFYAKNGTAQVVGMFQLLPPSSEKLKKFFDDQEKLRQNFKFQKSYAILGVALGNSKNLRLLSSNFYATFVRSGRGFVKL